MTGEYTFITRDMERADIDVEQARREMMAEMLVDTIQAEVWGAIMVDDGLNTYEGQARGMTYFNASVYADNLCANDEADATEQAEILGNAKEIINQRSEALLTTLVDPVDMDDISPEVIRAHHPLMLKFAGMAAGMEHALQEVVRDADILNRG